MKILADENIPYVVEAFSEFGEVETISGRTLNAAQLGEAEILLVRSVSTVNANLLENSKIRFVGTATIGVDHVDVGYLKQREIGFASAPACNAVSASEYVISVLMVLAERQGFVLQDKTVGIIGCGNVGSRVLAKLQALGVNCVVYDPLLQQKLGGTQWSDLATVQAADIITLHVPLEKTGEFPTFQMVNAKFLSQLRPDVILINSARGGVIDEKALLHRLVAHHEMQVVLDVWQNEPRINSIVLQRVLLGTPHIAGYSFDGKVRGTEMLYQALSSYLQQPARWDCRKLLPPPPITGIQFSDSISDSLAIQQAVLNCYDPRRDDAALRLLAHAPNPAQYFDQLRKQYPIRREFHTLQVRIPATRKTLMSQLQGLGFKVLV
jgi:erythronate-4-phosphate dehydrogenase